MRDVPALAGIRASYSGTQEYWEQRIAGYLKGEIHPQKALPPRVSYVAVEGDSMIGFIAGHLTRRYACDGELEWIDVVPEQRRQGVASELLGLLAAWFVEQNAAKICVNVAPDNPAGVGFYRRHGAVRLNEYFLVWNNIGSLLG